MKTACSRSRPALAAARAASAQHVEGCGARQRPDAAARNAPPSGGAQLSWRGAWRRLPLLPGAAAAAFQKSKGRTEP